MQSGNLVLRQEVQNGPGVAVGVVDDVPGGVLDGVAGVAGLRGHVVPHVLDGILGVAAIMLS